MGLLLSEERSVETWERGLVGPWGQQWRKGRALWWVVDLGVSLQVTIIIFTLFLLFLFVVSVFKLSYACCFCQTLGLAGMSLAGPPGMVVGALAGVGAGAFFSQVVVGPLMGIITGGLLGAVGGGLGSYLGAVGLDMAHVALLNNQQQPGQMPPIQPY